MLSGEATNTKFIVFGLTRSGLESTIYRTQGEYANNNTTDEVLYVLDDNKLFFIQIIKMGNKVVVVYIFMSIGFFTVFLLICLW